MSNIIGTTKSGKTIYDNFVDNDIIGYTKQDHQDAYDAMNDEARIAEAKHKAGDKLALDDRRYFRSQAFKHFDRYAK